MDILYIAGYSRSGSTLLAQILGRSPHLFNIGEFRHLWESICRNDLCGCGTPFNQCPFWARHLTEAFGNWTTLTTTLLENWRLADRLRYAPFLRHTAAIASQKGSLSAYVAQVSAIMGAISKELGSRTLVDSSKFPSSVYILQCIPGLRVIPVHLVRDSRAVAYSWQRKKILPERTNGIDKTMRTYSPLNAAISWLAFNALTERLAKAYPAMLRIRYEDFVDDPAATIALLTTRVQMPVGSGSAPDPVPQTSNVQHTIAGNPIRFAHQARIMKDEEWRQKMSLAHKVLVTAVTAPLLARYGYLQRRNDPT